MKRSEMVKKLEEYLDLRYSVDAEGVLLFLEKLGMEPPKIGQYVLPDGRPEFSYTEYVNKWEKEDVSE